MTDQQQDSEPAVHPSRPKTAFKRGAPRPPSAIRNFSISPDSSRPASAFAAPHLLPRSIGRAQSAPNPSSPLTKGSFVKASPSSAGTSHRRYTPVHPTCNLLLAKIWDDAAQKRHLHKLDNMKPQIDNGAPKHFDHLTHRSKKAQLQQEYLDRVQRENNLLCLRMARTDRPTISFSNLNPLFLASRLGDRKRAQEKKRIDEQNLMFIQRIEDQKAYYQKTQWKKDRTQNLAYLSNISRFPEVYTSSISPSPPQSKTSNKPPASPRHKHYDTTKMTDKFKPETVQKLVGDGKIRVGMTRAVLLRVEFLEKKKKKDEEEVGSRRAVPWLDSHAVAA